MIGTVVCAVLLTALAVFVYGKAKDTSADVERLYGSAMASPVATVVSDQWGYIVRTNAAFDRLFGYEPNERVGWQVSELVGPDSAEKHEEAFAAAMKEYRAKGLVKMKSHLCRAGQAKRKDGSTFWVAVLLSDPVVLSNGRTYLVAVIREEQETLEVRAAILKAKGESDGH